MLVLLLLINKLFLSDVLAYHTSQNLDILQKTTLIYLEYVFKHVKIKMNERSWKSIIFKNNFILVMIWPITWCYHKYKYIHNMSFYPDAILCLVCQEINAEMYMAAKHDQEYRISDVYILTIICTSYLIAARLNPYIWYNYSIVVTQKRC